MIHPRRERVPELMDQPGADRAQLATSLADLEEVNRWLGGSRVALDALAPLLRRLEVPEIRVLDVATGSADIPLAVAAWARQAGIRLRIVATDLHPETVEVARERTAGEPAVTVEQANALALPYPDGAFHYAMCHTALHHFDPPEATRVLRELGRVASHAVVVTDLVRDWTAVAAVRLLALTVWRDHPITRHDGPASVRAAFTADEMRQLAREAGLEPARVRTYLFFGRMSLVAHRARRRAGR